MMAYPARVRRYRDGYVVRFRDVPEALTSGASGSITLSTGVAGSGAAGSIVIGTGHFLSNSFLGNGGNLALGINMLNWLAGEDSMVTIDARPAADTQIEIDSIRLYLIAFVVLFALPLLFAGSGAAVWWRRRNAR